MESSIFWLVSSFSIMSEVVVVPAAAIGWCRDVTLMQTMSSATTDLDNQSIMSEVVEVAVDVKPHGLAGDETRMQTVFSAGIDLDNQSKKETHVGWSRLYKSMKRTWTKRMCHYRKLSCNSAPWWPVAPWRPRIVAYVICKYWLQVVWNDVSLKRSIFTNVAHGVTHSFPNARGWFAFIGDQEVCVISPAGSGMLTYLRLSESCVGMSFFIASLWRSRLESATSCIRHGAMRRANMDRTYFVMIKRYRRISEVKEDLSLLTNIDSEGPIQICALRDQGTQTEMYRPP